MDVSIFQAGRDFANNLLQFFSSFYRSKPWVLKQILKEVVPSRAETRTKDS